MPDSTLTALTAGTAPDGTELMYVVQSGNSRRLTALQIANAADAWATAAQGAAADTAIQPNTTTTLAGLTVTATFDAPAGSITRADLANSTALSIIGRSANSVGVPADIAAGTDHQVLRRSGTTLGFGAVSLDQAAAVTGALPVANGGTGSTTEADARTALGLGTAAVATVVTNDTDVTVGRLLTTVAGPAQAFRQGNIVGVVSQVAGVPTGAIVGYGSNANGFWVRFAGGLQLCWHSIDVTDQAIDSAYGSVFIGTRTWSFPAAFVAAPTVPPPSCKWGTGASWGSVTTGGGPVTTSVPFRFFDAVSRATGTQFIANFLAIGKWH